MFHDFIDFRKVLDRVWHAGTRKVLRTFSIEEGLIQAIQALYEDSSIAVLLNSQLGKFFKTTVGVLQEWLLSSILFKFFPEKIMKKTTHNNHTSMSIVGKPMCTPRVADDIYLMGDSNGELQDLTNRLVVKTVGIWNGSQHRKEQNLD